MPLSRAPEPGSGPGPWFTAALDGECSECFEPIEPGDTIRADGEGGWELQHDHRAEQPSRFEGTTLKDMGF